MKVLIQRKYSEMFIMQRSEIVGVATFVCGIITVKEELGNTYSFSYIFKYTAPWSKYIFK
jgi:hypothetical protein